MIKLFELSLTIMIESLFVYDKYHGRNCYG